MNRLARERSPYLLQHAANPVDWYPWGDAAFAKARTENKPIFLSVGYSTCHWCHVMEHESFESPAVSAVLNEHFVSIKVDREERPDVDRVYMTFVQATTGSGGWPMSVWLTPDLKPFYGGTYFPPTSRWGRPGFVEILQEVARVWRTEPDKVRESAEALTAQLRSVEQSVASGEIPGADALERTVRQFRQSFDPRRGGFGDAPKFPRPSELLFLLREHARTGSAEARDMVLATLRAMALGGMRDHIGGGFHRYSVDGGWRVPHFEKMLYDQAQLVLAFSEAAQASFENSWFIEVAEDTLRYVMRQMTDEAGGFYSAEDADSVPPEHAGNPDAHKMEGAFYLWPASEIDALLGDDASIVKRHFGIEPNGNAPMDPQQEFVGKNLLYVAKSNGELAAETGKSIREIAEVLSRARMTMFREQIKRPRPHLDDKVLTAWNGLMIAAFARVARLTRARAASARDPEEIPPNVRALRELMRRGATEYLAAAQRAAAFIHDRMWNPETRTLLRRYRDGHAEIEAYAEDYAYLIFGLIELFQADPDAKWLAWAATLQERQNELFWDEAGGGWFSTTGKDASVLLRMKEDYDGAEPSASSVSVMNLLVLSHLVENRKWTEQIERTIQLFGARLVQVGRAVPMMAAALSAHINGLQQIVIVGEQGAEELAQAVAGRYLPFAITLVLSPEQQRALAPMVPLVAAMKPVDGRAAVYVCRNFSCRAPVTAATDLVRELEAAPPSLRQP